MADASKGFVPMSLLRTGFAPAGRGRGSEAERDLVVPIRAEAARHEPRRLWDPDEMPAPRTIFPIPEPEPARDEGPEEPAGPTPEEIALMVQEAEQRGFKRGQASRQPEVDARRESEERLGQIADEIDEARGDWAGEAREELTAFVLGAVHHLVGDIPELLEIQLRQRLQDAVEHLSGARRVAVRVSPRDVGLALDVLGDREGWEVRADPEIGGGCIATSESGELDATVGAAIAAVDAAVQGWRDEQGG